MPRDRGLEQEVIDLGVAFGLPDVVAPDVRAVVGDDDGERIREPRVGEDLRQLLDELAPRAACCGSPARRWTSRLPTPRMPLSISRSRIATWSAPRRPGRRPARPTARASGRRSARRARGPPGRRSRCTRSGGASVLRRRGRPAVGRIDGEELVRPDALLVDARRGEQQAAAVGRAADPAAGPRHPALGVEDAEQLDQQLAGGLFGLAHRAGRSLGDTAILARS